MELITQLLGGQTGYLIAVGVLAFLFFLLVLFAMSPERDPLEARRKVVGIHGEEEVIKQQSLIKETPDSGWDRFKALFAPRQENAKAFDLGRLSQAGYRSVTALATYHTIRVGTMLLIPSLVALVGMKVFGRPIQGLYLYIAAGFVVGMVGPSYILDRKVESRITQLRNGLPDVLDLMVVCTESGLGMNATLLRVEQEIRLIHPEFAAELSMCNAEIRAGLDREVALNNITARTGLDDIKMLVTVLVQSARMGTSLGETLRVYSEEFRDKRMQAAEEAAAKLSTKMIFPLVFCFMPAFFVVAVGPAMLSIAKSFAH